MLPPESTGATAQSESESELLELTAEQRRLDLTWEAYMALIRSLSRTSSGGIDDYGDEAIDRLRLERLRSYTAASGPLYFGRIDTTDGETHYVGRHAVFDRGTRLLVVNWRAPAAERFYTATPDDPQGIALRRRLDIEERRVLGFVDELLASEGEDHTIDAIRADIARKRVGEMRQIISTITPEQYGLIAEGERGALVVQGGPGTGKTAVGLHRVAWLLYRQEALRRAGALVIGPNPTFMRYIGSVLPSLGEQGVEHRPIDGLLKGPRAPAPEDGARATLKGDGRMAAVLERLLWDRLAIPRAPVEIPVGRVVVEVAPDDLRRLVAAGRENGRSYNGARARFRERLVQLVAERAMAQSRALAGESHDDVTARVRKAKEHQALVAKVWPRETPEALVGRLLRNGRRLAVVAGDLLAAEEVALLTSGGRRDAETAADLPLLDEAHWLTDRDELRTFGHVVVDEAQNLSPMELRMAARRARGHSLTILGDIAQRTVDGGPRSWDELLDAAGVGERVVETLDVSYRVPDDFLRLAAGLVSGTDAIPRGVRAAPWAPVAARADASGLGEVAVAFADRMAVDVGSVGVVVPRTLMAQVRAALDGRDVTDTAVADLGPGINLCDLHVIKGLEFDAVVVVEPAAILAERPDGGRGGLYTALTRSTRALAIAHANDLPSQLATAAELRPVPAAGAGEAWAAGRREDV